MGPTPREVKSAKALFTVNKPVEIDYEASLLQAAKIVAHKSNELTRKEDIMIAVAEQLQQYALTGVRPSTAVLSAFATQLYDLPEGM